MEAEPFLIDDTLEEFTLTTAHSDVQNTAIIKVENIFMPPAPFYYSILSIHINITYYYTRFNKNQNYILNLQKLYMCGDYRKFC